MQADENKINSFLASSPIKTSGKKKSLNYARASYSLTQELKNTVIKLSKKVSIKCSDSDIIKVAIIELSKKDKNELEALIENMRSSSK